MAKLEGNYRLTGFYVLNRQKGFQNGDVYVFPDRKIVGNIADSNVQGAPPSAKKLLIGYVSPEMQLHMLKIPVLNLRGAQDVLWAFRQKDETSERSVFEGGYSIIGTGGRRHLESLSPHLKELVQSTDLEDKSKLISIMETVNRELLLELMFTSSNWEDILAKGQESGSSGEIELVRV